MQPPDPAAVDAAIAVVQGIASDRRKLGLNPTPQEILADACEHYRRELDALRARVGEPDDGEPVDVESLERMGFKGEPDEADTDVYDLQSANGGPTIRVWLRFRRGEIVESGMKLAWSYQSPGLPKVSMSHVITDNPTNGDVRKLISALGIALQEGNADGN